MSRIGKQPITVPSGVQVSVDGSLVTVKGPKGELSQQVDPDITLSQENGQVVLARPSDQPRHRSMHGLYRTLVSNMVVGVSDGFSKTLEMHGVGYRAAMQGKNLVLNIGFSHPVEIQPPSTIDFEVEGTSKIVVRGASKEQVGQVAADIRKIRPPEPYKGKGIRYEGEYVRRKAGKAGKAAG
ncbi:MAG: 50S ribosomal protein L6 [Dehalococcoidia bacterium]